VAPGVGQLVYIMRKMKFRSYRQPVGASSPPVQPQRVPSVAWGLDVGTLVCHASLVASESFESYAPGAVGSQTGGGTGWTGNWTAPGNVTRADVVDTTGNR